MPLLKGLASILTLGFGGSGGREGPTMQMGGAIGSIIGQYLRVTDRERRILLVAGTAAGMAAVFRTPLGAALLAVEVLHRDDFETEALVPSVLASVVAYSVFVSIFGESTLFAHAAKYPFFPGAPPALRAPRRGHLARRGRCSSAFFARVQRATARLPGPDWAKPAIGGLVLGAAFGSRHRARGPAARARRDGARYPRGRLRRGAGRDHRRPLVSRRLARRRAALRSSALAKIIATSLTVGSGGSAGDFGPSLVIGGIFGGAFGRAAQLLLHDPRIDPGAFALVGMGTFYGGLAHVPIARRDVQKWRSWPGSRSCATTCSSDWQD